MSYWDTYADEAASLVLAGVFCLLAAWIFGLLRIPLGLRKVLIGWTARRPRLYLDQGLAIEARRCSAPPPGVLPNCLLVGVWAYNLGRGLAAHATCCIEEIHWTPAANRGMRTELFAGAYRLSPAPYVSPDAVFVQHGVPIGFVIAQVNKHRIGLIGAINDATNRNEPAQSDATTLFGQRGEYLLTVAASCSPRQVTSRHFILHWSGDRDTLVLRRAAPIDRFRWRIRKAVHVDELAET